MGNLRWSGKIEVDETIIGGQEEGLQGRKNHKKRLIVLALNVKGLELVEFIERLSEKVVQKNWERL